MEKAMKEEDIRPAVLMDEKQQSLNADIAFLINQKPRWVYVSCPACDSETATPFGEKQGFSFVLCSNCGTVFTNPRPSLDLLHQFYERSLNYKFWNDHIFPATEVARREKIFKPRAERVLRTLRDTSPSNFLLLEVGAAYGWFCEEITSQNPDARVIAVEPSASLAETCRRKGIETKNVPIESLELEEQVDVVVAFEVIEHIFSPKDFIGHCDRLLRPGGAMFLSCPNLHGFDIELLGLKSSAFQHEHLNYFTPESISRLLLRAGFNEVQVSTPGELDVDIVRQHYDHDVSSFLADRFVKRMLSLSDPRIDQSLQTFLSANSLSSHMWAVARKPGQASN